jgi:hypothetical protein
MWARCLQKFRYQSRYQSSLLPVDLEVLTGDGTVRTAEPGLQVTEGSMDAGQQFAGIATGEQMGSLAPWPVFVPQPGQAEIAGPAIGVHDGAWAHVCGYKAGQVGTGASHLPRDQRCPPGLAESTGYAVGGNRLCAASRTLYMDVGDIFG